MRQGTGHLIAMSSVAGLRGVAGMSVYSATKAAQIGFIEGLRTEFLGTGLHASVVYPVSTRTEFHSRRCTAISATPSKATDRDRPSTEVAAAIVECIVSPQAEVYPYRTARWLAVLSRRRAELARIG